jgi:hypothetical protein
MKTILFLNVSILTLMLMYSSCKKDESVSPTNNTTPSPTEITIGTIRAKVDGTLKTADRGVKAMMNAGPNSVQISGVGGLNTNIITFNLGIGNFNGIGTYDLGVHDSFGLGINALYQEVALGSYACTPQYAETKGKLTVSEYTAGNSIKGTFYYKAKKQGTSGNGTEFIEVTEGEFYISLK